MAYDCNTIFNSKIICQCDIKMSQISQLKLQTRSKLNPSVETFCYWLVEFFFPKSSLFFNTELIFFDQKSKKYEQSHTLPFSTRYFLLDSLTFSTQFFASRSSIFARKYNLNFSLLQKQNFQSLQWPFHKNFEINLKNERQAPGVKNKPENGAVPSDLFYCNMKTVFKFDSLIT